jgi:hypothetical protein
MKTKLTLSIDRKRIMRARSISRRRKTTISALVEEMIDRLEGEAIKKKGKPKVYAADLLKGLMERPFTKKELAADPRLAHIMGKR